MYEETIYGSYPYIVRMTSSNGRKGFLIEDKKYLNDGNTISFAQDTFSVFYQKNPYFTGNKVKILKSKLDVFNEKIAQFIIASLNTTLKYFTWGTGSTTDSIGEIKLELPFLNGKINFSYMEKFIEELEAERIEELEAYLIATGLDDYKLSKEDEKLLDEFDEIINNTKGKDSDKLIGKITLDKLLEWQTGISEIDPLKLPQLYDESSNIYPFYGQATENNGIISYESLKSEVLNNKKSLPTILVHSNNQNIVYLDTPFYLKDGHGATSVLQNDNMDLEIALYIMTSIRKAIEHRFDYNAKATKIGLKNTEVEVPFKNNDIDYDYMRKFIRVVMKLVIKDVVLWADKKIEASKKVIK